MRKYQNLDCLLKDYDGIVNKMVFAELLIEDLNHAFCSVFGETIDDKIVLLAKLNVQQESIEQQNGMFQQRVEFVVEGEIINNEYPPITYSVDASTFRFYGRCSVIPQVCGVDLYLDKSYTKIVGDSVRQKFTIPIDKLYRSLKF